MTAGTLLKFVEGVPEVGDDIDGNTIEEVVPNIEHLPAQDTTPLTSTPEIITYVDGTTPTAPESTVNWFKDMSEVEKIDISGMNTDGTVDMTGMFSGDTKLQSIKIGESTDIATVVPKDFVLDAYVYSNPWKNPEKLIVTPTTANHDSMNFSIQNLTGQSVYGEIVIREICVQYTNKKDEIYSNDSQTMYVPSWGVGNMFGKSGAFTFLAGSCENNGKLLSNLFDSKYFKKAILKCNISGTNKNFEVALEAFAVNQVEKDACAGALCTKDESGNIAIRADSYTVNTIAPSITVNGKTYNDILGKWDLSSMRIAADNTQCTFSFGSDEATALLKDLIASSDASSRLTESASWRYFLLPDAVAQAIGKNNPNSGDICGLSVKWSPLRFQSGKLGIIDASQHVVNCIWE